MVLHAVMLVKAELGWSPPPPFAGCHDGLLHSGQSQALEAYMAGVSWSLLVSGFGLMCLFAGLPC